MFLQPHFNIIYQYKVLVFTLLVRLKHNVTILYFEDNLFYIGDSWNSSGKKPSLIDYPLLNFTTNSTFTDNCVHVWYCLSKKCIFGSPLPTVDILSDLHGKILIDCICKFDPFHHIMLNCFSLKCISYFHDRGILRNIVYELHLTSYKSIYHRTIIDKHLLHCMCNSFQT